VPEASVAAYEADQYWGSYNIVGADFSGINEVAANADSHSAKKCYNLNGVRLNPDELRPGLYIVNGKKIHRAITFLTFQNTPIIAWEKLYLASALMLSALAAHAYDFEVDGIYYDITSDDEKTVAVTTPKFR